MYKTAPKEVLEARPMGIRFAKEIGKTCNSKWDNGAQMSGLVGSLTLQNIIMSIAIMAKFPPGSVEGLAFLEKFYDGVKRDAMDRWNEADLQHHFGPNSGPKST